MKISCDISQNYFNCYSESKGVAVHRQSILKKKKPNRLNYYTEILIACLAILIISFLLTLTKDMFWWLFASLLALIDIIFLFIIIFNFLFVFTFRHKQKFKNTIILDDNGLTYTSVYNIKVNFAKEKLQALVIKKHTVTILTDTPCYFYFDINTKEKILEALKKYKYKTMIIK